MRAISDNLIHFLGRQYKGSPNEQFRIFKSIINDGIRCGKLKIKFGEGGHVLNQAVCFTDLPLSSCDEHTSIYGKFGIGFKKSFVKNKGGNPARYFLDYFPGLTLDETITETRGLLHIDLCSHFRLIRNLNDKLAVNPNMSLCDENGNIIMNNNVLKSWVSEQIMMLSFEKEMGDLGPARDETQETDLYYKEREWRLVPFQANVTSGTAELNEQGLYLYKFRKADINMIVTPNEEMGTTVLDFLLSLNTSTDERLKEFAKSPPPIICYDNLIRW